MSERTKLAFETEVERWITEGILVEYGENVNQGYLALMAVEQPTKGKVIRNCCGLVVRVRTLFKAEYFAVYICLIHVCSIT